MTEMPRLVRLIIPLRVEQVPEPLIESAHIQLMARA